MIYYILKVFSILSILALRIWYCGWMLNKICGLICYCWYVLFQLCLCKVFLDKAEWN